MDNYYVNPFNKDIKKKNNLFSGSSNLNTVDSVYNNVFNPSTSLFGGGTSIRPDIGSMGLKVKPIDTEEIIDRTSFTRDVPTGINIGSSKGIEKEQTPSVVDTQANDNLPINTQRKPNTYIPNTVEETTPIVAPEIGGIYSDEESTFMDEYYNSLLESSTDEYDPEKTLQEANRLFQDQIDAQEAYYNDLIEESRMRNQPEYQKNLDMLRLQQLAGGYGTSGAARAETQKQQIENQRIQNAQESVLRAEMQDKINAIQGNITNYAQKAKENFDKLKAESTEKYLQALRDRPTQRKAIIVQVVDNLLNMGIDIEDLSEEQIAEYAKQLSNSATGNITADNIRSEYKSLKSQYESAQKEAELEERKTLASIKKTEAETGQIGKVSPTTAAQIAWEREKAKMDGDDEEKPLTAEQIKQAIRPMLTTPEFKAMSKKEKRDYIYSQGGEPSDYGI